jgi:hypothetical protein
LTLTRSATAWRPPRNVMMSDAVFMRPQYTPEMFGQGKEFR